MYCPECLNTFETDGSACPNMMCGIERPTEGWGELLSAGDTFDRHYRIDRLLALAGAGLTYLAREIDASGAPQPPELAIKVLYAHRVSGSFVRRLANEAQILRELDHPNIVEYQGFVQRRNSPPYLITTFETGGTLYEYIRRVGAVRAEIGAAIVKQVLLALEQAHRRGVVHRDLKPQNVLLCGHSTAEVAPRIRVADFGIAKLADGIGGGNTRAGMFIGTPEFAAPEQFLGQPASAATDVFSVGGLLHYLVTARIPVGFSQRGDLATCYEELLAAIPLQLSPADRARPGMAAIQAVLDGTMLARPADRWPVAQLIAALEGAISGEPTAPSMPTGPDGAVTFAMAETGPVVPNLPAAPVPSARVPAAASVAARTPAPPVAAEPTAVVVQVDERHPNSLTLDDLFAVPMRTAEAMAKPIPTVPRPVGGRAESAAALVAPAAPSFAAPDRQPGRVVPVARPPAGARPAAPAARPAAPAPLAFPPPTADDVPDPLPNTLNELFALLAAVPFDARGPVVRSIERFDAQIVARLAGAWRPGTDPAVGEGLAFFAAATGRSDWASRLRGFLSDPEPRVRWAAASALGLVGLVASVSALTSCLRDTDADVRVAAVGALGRAAARAQRSDLARTALRPLLDDPDAGVRAAVALALAEGE